MKLDSIISNFTSVLCSFGSRILLAILILAAGQLFIKYTMKALHKSKRILTGDPTAVTYILNFIKYALYVMLFISIIAVLGVPMASVIAVLASVGVAIGLAMQGSLSNLAGGVMILIFRPFRVGDYVEVAGVAGTAAEVSLLYSTFISYDNKRVIVPNGTLMNSSIINCSSEATRRVDVAFTCAKGESPDKVCDLMVDTMKREPKILPDPAPFAGLCESRNEAMEFTARAWCRNADYWDVYFYITQNITKAFEENNIAVPVVRIQTAAKPGQNGVPYKS